MTTPLDKAVLAVRKPVKRVSGRDVVLRRYVDGEEVLGYAVATVGETRSEEFPSDDVVITVRFRDYLIDVADYLIGGELTEPQSDDQIDETIDGEVVTFQILPVQGEANRFSDRTRAVWRVHTREAK